MNEIIKAPMPLVYADLERLAASVAQSGLFGIKTKDQAIALMMIAHAEGRHPALAARDYDVIQGKPAKKAEAMMRDFIEAGGKVEWHSLTDDVADATFTHPQTGSVRIDWNMERARVAGFAGKDNWKKFPRAMLRSRVVSEGVRTVWPLATSGMYVPEEQADIERKQEDHSGPTIEAAAEPPPVAPIRAAAAPIPRAARIAERAPTYETPVDNSSSQQNQKSDTVRQQPYETPEQPKRMTWPQLLDSFALALKDAGTAKEITHILRSPQMTEARAHIGSTRLEYQRRFDEIMVMADTRRAALEADAAEAAIPEEDEVVIAGAENVAAG